MGGVFFRRKKVDLSSMQGALCTVSVFFILHFTYLGVCARKAPPAHHVPTGLHQTDFSARTTLEWPLASKYDHCTGWARLQCFDAVGWAAGKASGL